MLGIVSMFVTLLTSRVSSDDWVVTAELDADQVANLRARMPVWEHRRLKG